MPDGQNKLDRPVVPSRENLWLELQKAREKISVEVLTLRQRDALLLLSLLQKVEPPNYPKTKNKKNQKPSGFTLSDVCCAQLNRFWVGFTF